MNTYYEPAGNTRMKRCSPVLEELTGVVVLGQAGKWSSP